MKTEESVTTVSEAAREKGCTTQAIYDNLNSGDLNGFYVGESKRRLVLRDEKFKAFKVFDTGSRITRLKEKGGKK